MATYVSSTRNSWMRSSKKRLLSSGFELPRAPLTLSWSPGFFGADSPQLLDWACVYLATDSKGTQSAAFQEAWTLLHQAALRQGSGLGPGRFLPIFANYQHWPKSDAEFRATLASLAVRPPRIVLVFGPSDMYVLSMMRTLCAVELSVPCHWVDVDAQRRHPHAVYDSIFRQICAKVGLHKSQAAIGPYIGPFYASTMSVGVACSRSLLRGIYRNWSHSRQSSVGFVATRTASGYEYHSYVTQQEVNVERITHAQRLMMAALLDYAALFVAVEPIDCQACAMFVHHGLQPVMQLIMRSVLPRAFLLFCSHVGTFCFTCVDILSRVTQKVQMESY